MNRQRAESWLRRAVGNAPRPLPRGRFPQLLRNAEAAGFGRDVLLDVTDEWLNYGYCRIVEHIHHDIEILPEGEGYFYRQTLAD